MRTRLSVPSTALSVLLVALALTATLTGVAGHAVGRHPPTAVCTPCGDGFTDSVRGHGVPATVERSTATVRVAENGTAVWTVRNQLTYDDVAERLRKNESLLIAAADVHYDHGLVLQDARVTEDGTVVLRYRDENPGTTTAGGTLRYDYFRQTDDRNFQALGADRLTVVGPPGTTVTNAPTGAAIDGNSLTLTEYRDANTEGKFVTFSPASGLVGEAQGFTAIAGAVWPDVVRNLLGGVLFPAAALLGLLVATVRLTDRVPAVDDGRPEKRAVGVAALGLLPVGYVLFLSRGYHPLFVVFGVSYVTLALLAATLFSDVRTTLPRVGGSVVASVFVGLASTVALAAAFDRYFLSRLAELNYYAVNDLLVAGTAAFLLLSLVVVGYATTDGRHRRAALCTPPLALAVALASNVSLTADPEPTFLLAPLLFVAFAVVIVVFGLPAFFLGRALPDSAEGR